ncbi:MAG: ROK family protein [Candidatus Limnocylindrales bacterium]
MSPRPVLALDVGGTQVRAAVVTDDGDRIARIARPTPISEGPESILRACIDALVEARAAVPRTSRDLLVGVGISSPGPVDPWRGVVIETPNMGPAYRNVPIADRIEDALGLPAYLDRDTNVAALGEMAFGAGRDCPDFLYLTVSTGIGGAIVMGGRIVHGPDGTAGELGHMTVSLDGPVCACGGLGHLEAHASGTALAIAAGEALAAGRSPFLERRAASKRTGTVDARDVAEGEEAGDEACHELMEHARRAFALACVGFVNALNPTRIVVGGSVAEGQGERLLGAARAEVARTAFHTPRARVRIVPAELGPDVGLAGAHPLVTARLGDPSWRRGRSTHPSTVSG